jgi:hypothetical protein
MSQELDLAESDPRCAYMCLNYNGHAVEHSQFRLYGNTRPRCKCDLVRPSEFRFAALHDHEIVTRVGGRSACAAAF